MATRVRSYSKINLGLGIGPVRGDGFHELTTLYQTLEAHDLVTVSAEALGSGGANRIVLTSNDRRVPLDGRNTVWKMLGRALALEPFRSRGWAVRVHIDKRLPIQGGLGAGSANAAAALVGLERETGLALTGAERLRIAAEVGSDVPLFLIGGAVLGLGRGELVFPMPDLVADRSAGPGAADAQGAETVTVVLALSKVGVSTPQAFRDWDALASESAAAGALALQGARAMERDGDAEGAGLANMAAGHSAEASLLGSRTILPGSDGGEAYLTHLTPSHRLEELSRALAAALCEPQTSSGVFPANARGGLAGQILPALVRTGIRNDFEEVVFRQYPLLGTIKRALLGVDGKSVSESAPGLVAVGALYAALSGSGSALFGLYGESRAATEAEARVQSLGIRTLRTRLLSRAAYWQQMCEPQSERQ